MREGNKQLVQGYCFSHIHLTLKQLRGEGTNLCVIKNSHITFDSPKTELPTLNQKPY